MRFFPGAAFNYAGACFAVFISVYPFSVFLY